MTGAQGRGDWHASPFIVNEYRTARVAEILSDFRTLQYYIAAAPAEPDHPDDYYTEGWSALQQCAMDGQHILNCGADTSVPNVRGGPEEQAKAELQQWVITFLLTRASHPFPSNRPAARRRESVNTRWTNHPSHD